MLDALQALSDAEEAALAAADAARVTGIINNIITAVATLLAATLVAVVAQVGESKRAARALHLERLGAAKAPLTQFLNEARSYSIRFRMYFSDIARDPSDPRATFAKHGTKIGEHRAPMEDALAQIEVLLEVLGATGTVRASLDELEQMRRDLADAVRDTRNTKDPAAQAAAAKRGQSLCDDFTRKAREIMRSAARAMYSA